MVWCFYLSMFENFPFFENFVGSSEIGGGVFGFVSAFGGSAILPASGYGYVSLVVSGRVVLQESDLLF